MNPENRVHFFLPEKECGPEEIPVRSEFHGDNRMTEIRSDIRRIVERRFPQE